MVRPVVIFSQNNIKESEQQKSYLAGAIEKLLIEMDKFADGDLGVFVVHDNDDEIGKLYNGFNKSVQNIKSMMLKVTEAVNATANVSGNISSSSEEMAAGAQEQSAQTTEVASAVEQMTKTILKTTKHLSSPSILSLNSFAIDVCACDISILV